MTNFLLIEALTNSSRIDINTWAIVGIYMLLIFIALYITNVFKRVSNVFIKTPIQTYITTDAKLKSVELNVNGIINCDNEGIVLTWNKGATKIFGYDEYYMLGKSIFTIFPGNKKEQYKKEFFEFRDTGFSEKFGRPFKTIGLCRNKNEIHIEVALSHWKNEQTTFFTVIVIDITELKKLEETFDKLMNLYKEAENIEGFGAWKWNLVTDEVFTTQGYKLIYDIPEHHPTSYNDSMSRVHYEDKERVSESMAKAIRDKTGFTLEYRIIGANGRIKNIRSKTSVHIGPSGVDKIFGVVQEIKDIK
jgi:PAS domain S-box-containing protein